VAALDGSIFHTHAWASFVSHDRGGQPVFVRWVDTGGHVAALAVGSLKSPLQGRLASAALALSFDAPPAVADDVSTPCVNPLGEWAHGKGAVALVLGSFDGGERSWEGDLRDRDERIEFLAPPADELELWRRMRKGSRSAVRRAERRGVEVERAGQTHAGRFADLFASTVARLKREKQVVLGEVDTNNFETGLAALLAADGARLYLASLHGESIGGCVFGVQGTRAYYLFNGSSKTGLSVGATPLTLLRAMTELSADGITAINLGGVPGSARDPASPDHGLYAFKLGLGGEPLLCRGGRLRLRPVRLALFDLARSIRARAIR
jgi:hypothetical protein